MGRPPLPPGSPGKVGTTELPDGWRARCNFRGFDGVTRPIARYGATEAKAKRALSAAVTELIQAGGLVVDSQMRVRDLIDDWLDRLDEAGDLAVGTRQQYRKAAEAYVKPAVGAYRVAELNVVVCDRALREINTQRGYPVAKLARAVMAGAFSLATRHGALPRNPMRDVDKLRSSRKPARGLTPDEATELCDRLRAHARAVELDLPDLVEFALATGARIGELLACREASVDLRAGTWHVDATVVRVTGHGLKLLPPKTPTSDRVLALPPFAVDMLTRRQGERRLRAAERPVFPSPSAKSLRDPSNCAGDLREVLAHLECPRCGGDGYDVDGPCEARGPFAWITFHTFRKTVATLFDQAGQSARLAADQLGHSKPTMTLDRYYSRKVANPAAATILDR